MSTPSQILESTCGHLEAYKNLTDWEREYFEEAVRKAQQQFKTGYDLAVKYIEESPCDPDITKDQRMAYKNLIEWQANKPE